MYVLLVRKGDKYGPEYAEKLRRAVKATSGLETVVLGDDLPFRYDWPGWWAKMEIFSPHIQKPFIYIDLDSIVLKDISDINTDFRMIAREWNRSWGYQSSFMCINKSEDIWEEWIERPHEWMDLYKGGDQDFLYRFDFETTPDDLIGSYKLHSRESPKHRIVTFHGEPKPHKCDGWVKEIWSS